LTIRAEPFPPAQRADADGGGLKPGVESRKVRIPYFTQEADMLAKMTSKNQLTLPKSVTAAVDSPEYFEVEARNGQIVLTPVRIQRGDAVRAKLAELGLQEQDIADAVQWARQAPAARTARKKK